jgi:hypothetical protein
MMLFLNMKALFPGLMNKIVMDLGFFLDPKHRKGIYTAPLIHTEARKTPAQLEAA